MNLEETERVLLVADSLRADGVAYRDSIGIAKACEAYGTWWNRNIHPLEYAKANYYYGRLLREKDNPVAAMQCFINASHTDPALPFGKRIGSKYRRVTADDYNLLGRVYSNIGTLCHLADEFSLSAEMYERCAEQFQKANNTTAYYYALNDIAFELGEQHKKVEAFDLLNQIAYECTDSSVYSKILETQALTYRNCGQYDSAIFIVDRLLLFGYNEPTALLIKAQSFSYLNMKDSSLHYAHKVIDLSNHYGDIYNALYILSYDDSTLTNEKILELTSERDDIHTYEIEEQKSRLAQATQLLNQDMMNNTTEYRWLYVVFAVVILIVAIIVLLITNKKTTQKHNEVEKYREQVLDFAQKTKQELQQVAKIEELKRLELSLSNTQIQQQLLSYRQQALETISEHCKALQQSTNIREDLYWKDYTKMCEVVNKYFYLFANKLHQYPNVSEREIRLCVLVVIDLPQAQIAEMLNYALNGVGKFKYRVAKKLGTNSQNMRDFLLNLAIGGHKD